MGERPRSPGAWVGRGVKPRGTNVMAADLRKLDRTFESSPRPSTREADAVPGARDRVMVHGRLTVNGAPLTARWLGAVVLRDGLVTPCQFSLPQVDNGNYSITVLADAESTGCGKRGASVVLWTFADDTIVYNNEAVAWPERGHAVRFDGTFTTAAARGAAPSTAEFTGLVVHPDGREYPAGTRVEAYVGSTRCGVASTRRTGNYSGYILAVVGPDSIPGCTRGAPLTFRVDGRPVHDGTRNEPHRGDSFDLTVP